MAVAARNDSNEQRLQFSMFDAEHRGQMIRVRSLSEVLSFFKFHHNRKRRRLAGDPNDLSPRQERRTVIEDFTWNYRTMPRNSKQIGNVSVHLNHFWKGLPLLLLSSLLFLLLDSFSRRKVSDRNLSLEVYQSHLRRRILSQK